METGSTVVKEISAPDVVKEDVISVIIPTYNRAHELRQCIESVLNQDDVPIIEFVIVDDGSTDLTKVHSIDPLIAFINQNSAIKKRYKLIYLLVKDGPRGPSSTRTTGTVHCTGNYIMYLDSDDTLYDRNALSSLYKVAKAREEEGKGPQFVYGDTLMLTPSGSGLWEPQHLFSFPKFSLEKLVASEGLIPMGSFLFSREITEKVASFNPEMRMGEDFEWQLRVARNYPFFHIPRTILKYNRSASGNLNMSTQDPEIRQKNRKILSDTKADLLLSTDFRIDARPVLYSPGFTMGIPVIEQLDDLCYGEKIPVDILYKNEVHKHLPGSQDILWILSEIKMNRRSLNEIKDYSTIITYNCALSNKLEYLLEKPVHTVQMPFAEELYPLTIRPKKAVGDSLSVLLLEEDKFLEDELEVAGINYHIVDEEDQVPYLQSFDLVILPRTKYFNAMGMYEWARLQLPILTTGTKGRGFIPNGHAILIRHANEIEDTLKNLKTLKDVDLHTIGGNGYSWCSGNEELTLKYFTIKMSSVLEQALYNKEARK